MNFIEITKNLSSRFIFVITIVTSFAASAETERHIHINGEHLNPSNIQRLDQVVGSAVGDGFYWLNMHTGQWGIEGNNQVQGIIASIANQTQIDQQQSDFANQADRYNDWEGVDSNGGVVSGTVNGQNCTYVSVAGMTMKDCD